MKKIKVLFSRSQIENQVYQLSKELNKVLELETDITILSVLNGAFIFTADLVRYLDKDVECEFIKANSYIGKLSKETVDIYGEEWINPDRLTGKTVVLVEDIIDTGITVKALKEKISLFNPKQIYTVALVDKPSRRKVEVKPDFVGFTIEDVFIAGYGMDYNGKYRSLPSIITID